MLNCLNEKLSRSRGSRSASVRHGPWPSGNDVTLLVTHAGYEHRRHEEEVHDLQRLGREDRDGDGDGAFQSI